MLYPLPEDEHGKHEDEAGFEKKPAGHVKHEVEATLGVYRPPAQGEHELRPGKGLKNPAVQFVQLAWDVAP